MLGNKQSRLHSGSHSWQQSWSQPLVEQRCSNLSGALLKNPKYPSTFNPIFPLYKMILEENRHGKQISMKAQNIWGKGSPLVSCGPTRVGDYRCRPRAREQQGSGLPRKLSLQEAAGHGWGSRLLSMEEPMKSHTHLALSPQMYK